jgi:hypothetical protein
VEPQERTANEAENTGGVSAEQITTTVHDKPTSAVVFLAIDKDGEETEEVKKDVAAGPTLVSQLKVELGVTADAVLWLVSGQRKQFDDSETIDVKDGMHFEAIEGGGIS